MRDSIDREVAWNERYQEKVEERLQKNIPILIGR